MKEEKKDKLKKAITTRRKANAPNRLKKLRQANT